MFCLDDVLALAFWETVISILVFQVERQHTSALPRLDRELVSPGLLRMSPFITSGDCVLSSHSDCQAPHTTIVASSSSSLPACWDSATRQYLASSHQTGTTTVTGNGTPKSGSGCTLWESHRLGSVRGLGLVYDRTDEICRQGECLDISF